MKRLRHLNDRLLLKGTAKLSWSFLKHPFCKSAVLSGFFTGIRIKQHSFLLHYFQFLITLQLYFMCMNVGLFGCLHPVKTKPAPVS